jgi:Ca-activated chloride channel family protein
MSSLSISLSTDKSMYLANHGSQLIHVLIEAASVGVTESDESKVNFCLVLDRSGSMQGEKLKSLKAAAIHLVHQLDAEDILSVVAFDDIADVIVPATPVGDRAGISALIDKITERGGTSMSTGMQAGLLELAKSPSTDRVTRMLILTDGQTWEDQDVCRQLASQAGSQGIPLSVMGMGVGEEGSWDPQFIEELATLSGGEWYIIDSPSKISPTFSQALSSMKGTTITNARLTIRFAEGVVPKSVIRAKPLINKLDQRMISDRDAQVFLGDMDHHEGQAVLIDVVIPQRAPQSYRLMQVEIMYDVPREGLKDQKTRLDAVFSYTTEPGQCVVNRRVMNFVERVAGHIANTIALDEAEKGDPRKAAGMFQENATHLLELGHDDLAQQALDMARQLEQNGQAGAGETQRLRYTTRRLTENDQDKSSDSPVQPV